MKKKELEILLQAVPSFKNPILNLEQYMTPAVIVSDIIFNAYQMGDIQDKIVIDLGCGTGIFSIGAKIARASKVIGIDIDKKSIQIAKKYAKENRYEIKFEIKDIKDVSIKCDTVFMNPPFGARKNNLNADRKFIEKGFEIAPTIYSLHLTKTIPFINKLVVSLGGIIDYSKNYEFPIKWMYEFHKKKELKFYVTLLRINTTPQ